MNALLIGYAHVSTHDQDLTVQREALLRLGVTSERISTDQGLTGTDREPPGLRQAMAACRDGDTFVATKLDRWFESDLIRARTREGMQLARAKGRLRGRAPKLSAAQQELLMQVRQDGTHTSAELSAVFNVSRATVYRTIQRNAGGVEGRDEPPVT